MHTLDALLCSAVKQILMGIPSFQCHQDINLPGEACCSGNFAGFFPIFNEVSGAFGWD